MANRRTEVPNPRSTQLRRDDAVSQRSGIGDDRLGVSDSRGSHAIGAAEADVVPGDTDGAGTVSGVGGVVGIDRGSGMFHRNAETQLTGVVTAVVYSNNSDVVVDTHTSYPRCS